jgi:hypothetical protein
MTVLTLLLALPAAVFALGFEMFGNAPVAKGHDWAEGVVDVVNLKSRVYMREGGSTNANFFYRGNPQALNEALRKYAAVKDDVRQLILLPGSGKTQSLEGKRVDFNWMFHVPSGRYKALFKRTHAVMTAYVNGTRPRPLKGKEIENWLRDLDNNSFQTREKAEQELQRLGNDAKPLLREALRARPTPEARRRIESSLDQLGAFIDVTDLEVPKGITIITVDDLLAVHLKGLKDADMYVRGMAIEDLSVVAAYSDKVVPAITEKLKDDNEWVRCVAVNCLGNAGAIAKSAIPALKEGLQDTDPTIRKAFQTAIDQIENAKGTPGQDSEVKRNLSILKEINELKEMVSGTIGASKQ